MSRMRGKAPPFPEPNDQLVSIAAPSTVGHPLIQQRLERPVTPPYEAATTLPSTRSSRTQSGIRLANSLQCLESDSRNYLTTTLLSLPEQIIQYPQGFVPFLLTERPIRTMNVHIRLGYGYGYESIIIKKNANDNRITIACSVEQIRLAIWADKPGRQERLIDKLLHHGTGTGLDKLARLTKAEKHGSCLLSNTVEMVVPVCFPCLSI
ncbi:hypothetical protein M422DRAFT_271018 [Sphaerobolus stellatus SS14]|uniref:Uncharacterized protein n=1 Tax=Sphaerobolus stellatus (strain SS14) TaxID=990650 RepID=A0A0C9U192_SPHS4|nr:hypothetical protein M422DRAFT_271018 [Sphaerobolus stellatus SS14]